MNWHSWSDFVAMGGYGAYVWGSVIAVFVALAAEMAGLALRWKMANEAPLQRNPATSGGSDETPA